MPLSIELFSEQHIEQARELNKRFASQGVDSGFWLPEACPRQHPPPDALFTKQQFVVLLDGVVRGGYILQRQPFWLGGETVWVGNCQMPISEGIIDRRYASLGVQMINQLTRSEPLLFCLGMGGFEQPLPRLLKALGWQLQATPFFFRVLSPARFVEHMRPLRERPTLRRFAAFAPWGISLAHSLRGLANFFVSSPDGSASADIPASAGEIWKKSRSQFGFAASRETAVLKSVYALHPRCQHLSLPDGWAMILDTQMRQDKYFGDLRVGTLVDLCALPGAEASVIASATSWLRSQGCDLIVTNQSAAVWQRALRRAGYLSGPSNYVLATARQLSARLQQIAFDHYHFTRGDGEGPTHL